MKIISTNIGSPTKIIWNGKEEETGIYKYPVSQSIFLGKTDVAKDSVIDRKHHGGSYKACYLFASDNYPYWKDQYPHLKWDWGMFGENLTVSGLDETKIRIGNIYKIGESLVQVTQPREPCYKLGIRFEDQLILRKFITHGFPGTYVRVLEEGMVKAGDELILVEESTNKLTVKDFFELLYDRNIDQDVLKLAIANEALPQYKRIRLKKHLKQ